MSEVQDTEVKQGRTAAAPANPLSTDGSAQAVRQVQLPAPVAERVFVYVDGESHFHRSQDAWRKIHGKKASLARLRFVGDPASQPLILVESDARVFWTKRMNPDAVRIYYYTAMSGSDPQLHVAKEALRVFGLEPRISHEVSQLFSQRANRLATQNLIEKAKGVDIALTVRMLQDAQANAFSVCHLYTSDIDFLPLVEAVRDRGKSVNVFGYRDGLSKQSEYLHACDRFVDLEDMLRNEFEPMPEGEPTAG